MFTEIDKARSQSGSVQSSDSEPAVQQAAPEGTGMPKSRITWTAQQESAIADPSHAQHCMAAAVIEQLGLDAEDTRFADKALGKLFPPELQTGGVGGIRPMSDWVMFRARREIVCEDGVTPEPAFETRRFSVYANDKELSCSDVDSIVHNVPAGGLASIRLAPLSVLEFASGSPELTGETTLDSAPWSGEKLGFAAIVSLTPAAAAEGTVTALGRLLRVKALVNEAGILDAGDVQCLVLDENPLPGIAAEKDGIVLLLFCGAS